MVELNGRALAALLLALLLVAPLAVAQESTGEALAPRRLLLVVTQAPGFGLSTGEMVLAQRSMLLALQEARPDLVLAEPARQAGSASNDELSLLAGESGADCWLLTELSGTREQPSIRVRSFDVLSSAQVIDRTIRRKAGAALSTATLAFERWEDVSALLAATYPPRAAPVEVEAETVATGITVRALPGTIVSIVKGGKGRARVGEDGAARLDLPAVPSVVEVRAVKQGYLPERRTVYVRSERDISVEQAPAPRLAIDTSLLLAWPGVAVTWAPVPELLFVRGGLTTYLLGLVMRSDAFITTDPFSMLDLLAAAYLNPADAPVRFYAGAGAFLRIVHAPNLLFGIDPLVPFGFEAAIGAELPIGPSAKVFAELQPMLYMTDYPGMLLSTQQSSGGWIAFTRAALQLASVRVGLRWPR